LFPPSTAYSSQSDNELLQSGLEDESGELQSDNTQVREARISSNVSSWNKEAQTRESNETSSIEHESLIDHSEEDWNEEYQDNSCGIGNLQQADKLAAFQQNSLNSDLAIELRNLTKAVETHSSVHERILQLSLNEKAKNVTNSAMNLLRDQGTPCSRAQENVPTVKAMNPSIGRIHDNIESNLSFDLTILVQITEIKCTLNTIKDEIQNAKSTREENHAQNLKIQDEIDEGNTDASESCDGLCDILNKLEEINNSLRHIESGLHYKGDPLLQKSLTDKKEQVVENTSEVISGVDANVLIPIEQETKLVDNEDAACLSHSLADCNTRSQDLLSALNYLTKENTNEQVLSCAQMLYMYAMNLSTNPNVPRYRKVFTTNNAFKQKVDNVEGARNILTILGFVDQGSYLEWKGDDNEIESMGDSSVALLKEATEALSLLKTGSKLNVGTTGIKTKENNTTVNSNYEYVDGNKNIEDSKENKKDNRTP